MEFNKIIYVCAIWLCLVLPVYAQEGYDKNYVEDHSKDFTVRLYTSYKFNGYRLGQYGFKNSLAFKSNDNYNIGTGIHFRSLGLNVAVKAPLINDNGEKKGQTVSLDLQTYMYLPKWAVDLYAQFYKGYYLSNDALLNPSLPSGTYLVRPDLRTGMLGVNVQRIFNYKRFSYRSAFVQNEYQKKSAGSFIVGGGIHLFHVKADSAIVPGNISDKSFIDGSGFDRSNMICIAMSAGYAQTWVIKDHYFLMASAMGGIGINVTGLSDGENEVKQTGSGLQLNGNVRMAAGYNSAVYFAGIQFMGFTTRNTAPIVNSWQEFNMGNFRIVVAKRFKVVKKSFIRKVYDKIPPPLL